MTHGPHCNCALCAAAKDHAAHDAHHDSHQHEHAEGGKGYVCENCGSKSEGKPGSCCGAERHGA